MKHRVNVCLATTLLAIFLAGCSWSVNPGPVKTLPPLLAPEDPPQQVTLLVPEDLEIRSIDFSASVYTDSEDGTTTIPWELGGRAFISAHAVHKRSGEAYLLLYENVAERRMPVQIIRFRTEKEGPGEPSASP
jgi:hypothetical protein